MKKLFSIILALTLMLTIINACVFSAQAQQSSKLRGDVTLDEYINIQDVTQIQKCIAEIEELTDYQKLLADVDSNNSIDIIDATLIQKYIAELENEYGVGNEIETAPVETTQPATEEATTAPPITSAIASKLVYSDNSVSMYDKDGNLITEAMNVNVTNNTYAQIITPDSVEVSGSCSNGQLSVNIDKTEYTGELSAIEITLNGLTLSNENDSPIYVACIDDYCTFSVKKGSINTISDGASYLNSDDSSAAIYAKDDLKIKGKGTLNVNGNCDYGICAKDDLKLWNGKINVKAKGTGIKGKDSVRIGDPDDLGVDKAYNDLVINIESDGDGIRSNNSTDTGKGFVTINGGSITIKSQQDAIQAEQSLTVNGGTIDITTYKGSAYNVASDSTAKGIKSEGALDLNGGTIEIDSSDDCIHCGDVLTFTGGVYQLSSGDDGVHSDNVVNINGGDITILKSYEGIEGYYIYINDGNINLVASDDGINAAGGNDGSSPSFGPGTRPGSMQSSSKGYLYINGGEVFVNAKGDGLDANGTITMTGGLVIVSGSEDGGNGALDYDSTFTITGGVLLATGNSSMAQNVSSASGVCSAKINTSSTIDAGTMIAINNGSDNLITAKIPKKCNSIVFASPDLKTGTSNTLYTGGSYSGDNKLDWYYYNGTYTPGASAKTWTQSTAIYNEGSSGSNPSRPR